MSFSFQFPMRHFPEYRTDPSISCLVK